MKLLITLMLALLLALPAFSADDPEATFVAFMEMVQSGNLKKAIKEYGIDERADKSLVNIKTPGNLNYEIKNIKTKKNGKEASISALIDYETVTEGAKDTASNVATAGKAVSGNVAGAAGDVAKNKLHQSTSSITKKEKVRLKREGGEWKVVVTDKLYRALTNKK